MNCQLRGSKEALLITSQFRQPGSMVQTSELIITSAKQEVMFCPFCVFVCQQYSSSCRRILMKLFGGVGRMTAAAGLAVIRIMMRIWEFF